MKTAETHTTATQHRPELRSATGPFFRTEGRQGFFSEQRTVAPFFSPVSIQPKLKIGAPDDAYEREADQVAEQVVQRLAAPNAAEPEVAPARTVVQPAAAPSIATATATPIARVATPETGEEMQTQEEEGGPPIRRKAIFDSAGEEETVQRKCMACAAEEEGMVRRMPHTDAELPPIQRKCAACGAQEEVRPKPVPGIQRTGDGGLTANAAFSNRLQTTKGGGVALPAATRTGMESAMGSDFSGVRVHTGGKAADLSQSIGAQAFTHGSDIYFNRGKYDPESTGGQRLLAHELTHTVQQGKNSTVRRIGFRDLKYASPQYWQYRVATWGAEQAWNIIEPEVASVNLVGALAVSRDDYYDIRGKTTFSPPVWLWIKMLNYFRKYRTNRVPVKVKYGSLAKGTILLEADNNYRFSTTAPFLLHLRHPGLKVDTGEKALALEVNVSNNKISGSVGVPKQQTGDDLDANRDVPQVNFGRFDSKGMYPVLFGEAYADDNFTRTELTNALTGGYIDFLIAGWLDTGNRQYLVAGFLLYDKMHHWIGKLQTRVQGAADFDLPVERTAGGYLSGESEALQLDGKWKGEGFALTGGLKVAFANKALEIYGTASYTSSRLAGTVDIAVLPLSKAQTAFRAHVPVAATPDAQASAGAKPSVVPGAGVAGGAKQPAVDPDDPLALTAWGSGTFKLIDKAKTLSGTAAFAVDPEGRVITAGMVKLQKDFVLMDQLNKEYELFSGGISTNFLIAEVPVLLELDGRIAAGYFLGPVVLYELVASGAYSNHPEYASELCLGAKFEMPAALYLTIDMVANATVGVDFKLFKVRLIGAAARLSATGKLNAYVNARPAIGMTKAEGKAPEYCLAGRLTVGGEMVVEPSADLELVLFRKAKSPEGEELEKEVKSRSVFGSWTVGNFGFGLDVDYVLGSGETPNFEYLGGEKFDKKAFKRALKKRKPAPEKDPELRGGFKQDGEEKGVVDDESIRDQEPDESNNPLGPFERVEHFDMNGTDHKLYLLVAGTEGDPEVDIEMASDRDRLIDNLTEEILILEQALSAGSFFFTEEERKKMEARIRSSRRLREKTEKIIAEAKKTAADPELPTEVAAPGFETLDDEIGAYGDQYGVNDLGIAADKDDPSTTPETDGPPAGEQIRLVLPPQKAIYLSLYRSLLSEGPLQHSTTRGERDTDQQSKWDKMIKAVIPRDTYCQGRGLGLTPIDIYRPYWSQRYLDASRKSRRKPKEIDPDKIPRMQVDHVIEWQVRPLHEGDWVDQPWNFELLDASSNGSSGPKLNNNITKERERLRDLTGDDSWLTKDITFTEVVAPGSAAAERWNNEEIEDGDHLYAYRILTGEVVDPDQEKAC